MSHTRTLCASALAFLLGAGGLDPALADGGPAPAPAPAPASPPAPPPAPAPGAPAPAAPAGGTAAEPAAPPRPLQFPNEGVIERADGRVVYFYRTNFVTAGDLIKGAGLMGVGVEGKDGGLGVRFTPFEAQNQVLVEGFPEAVEIALEALAYFDVPAPQVFIETKVIEVTWDSNFEFGLDHALDRNISGPRTFWRGISGILSPPSFIASTLPGGLPFQGTNLLFGLVGNGAEETGAFDFALRALQESGKAEVLSKPSIICTQGKEATVTTSERFQVNQFKSATTTVTGPDAVNEQVQYGTAPAETGVTLKVTPDHVGESYVTITINPTVKGLAGFASRIGGTLSPIETTRTASTKVTMADGETLVLGGLYTNRTVREEAKTPLLSDIPVLGLLFTRQREAKQKSELIFMLTPRIVRKNTDPRVITPPAELERLEKKPSEDEEPCGFPCEPNGSIEDWLFPRTALCRNQGRWERERKAAREAAAKDAAGARGGAAPRPTSSAALPPPPAAPTRSGPTAAPAAAPPGPGGPPAPVIR